AVDVHVPGVGSDRGAVTTGVAVVGASELGASRPTAWGRRGATVGGARTLPDDDHEQIAGTDRVGIGRSNAGARCCRVDRRGCGLEPDGRIRRAGRFDGERDHTARVTGAFDRRRSAGRVLRDDVVEVPVVVVVVEEYGLI